MKLKIFKISFEITIKNVMDSRILCMSKIYEVFLLVNECAVTEFLLLEVPQKNYIFFRIILWYGRTNLLSEFKNYVY